MSADTNYPSTHHRIEPMREGFVWWDKNSVSCSAHQRNTGSLSADLRYLNDTFVTQASLFDSSSDTATSQIPIDHRIA
jgi:hypothetical protein